MTEKNDLLSQKTRETLKSLLSKTEAFLRSPSLPESAKDYLRNHESVTLAKKLIKGEVK